MLFYKSDLASRSKQIMFYLINRANTEETCFLSNKTIASDCGISIILELYNLGIT